MSHTAALSFRCLRLKDCGCCGWQFTNLNVYLNPIMAELKKFKLLSIIVFETSGHYVLCIVRIPAYGIKVELLKLNLIHTDKKQIHRPNRPFT